MPAKLLLALLLCNLCAFAAQPLLTCTFDSGADNWISPDYWSGTLSHNDKAMRLLPAEKNGKTWGRAYVPFRSRTFTLPGRLLNLEMRVKGEGQIVLGSINYCRNAEGKSAPVYAWDRNLVTLTPEWSTVHHQIDLSRVPAESLGLCIELKGAGELFFDDVALHDAASPAPLTLTAAPTLHVLTGSDSTAEVAFTCSDPQADVTLFLATPGQPVQILPGQKGDAAGRISCRPDAAVTEITAASRGVVATAAIARVEPAAFAALDQAAARVKLTRPLHILYLGDSLLDFNRGLNTADKVNYFLHKYNPGKASFRNAAIGGDYITRVERRLDGKEKYRAETYASLFTPPADLVFILLGHNDTKTNSKNNFSEATVPPEQQEASYRQVIDRLRREMPQARIVLLSSTSSNYEMIAAKSAEKLKTATKPFSRFGEPARMEAFNQVLKKLADELKLEYVDLYTPMRDLPDKAALLNPNDGVHLTLAGHDYLAARLLEFLAR